ncbi:MAG: sulfatase, partial [Flavobacteriaceae bacterium]|nr:sulfatase [Flavobacteriaceae bacterium]
MNYVLSIKQLLLRLLLLVFLYQFCRANFYFFNQPLFSNVGAMEFLGGLRFDLSAIFFSNALIIILSSVPGNFKYTPQYQKVLKILFFIINAVFIATNFIDVKYFEFTGKRSTFALITASGMKSDLVRLLPSFLKSYWYLFLLYVVTIA